MSNWYLESGTDSDIVKSSRIRIARNIKNMKFEDKLSLEEKENIINYVKEALAKTDLRFNLFRLKDMDDLTLLSLIEKHLISHEFAVNSKETGAIYINEEENICIMINEEDHIRIQAFASGLELDYLLNLAYEVEEKIGKNINFAYSDKFGYLTMCPSNVGTGLRISVMVHLPALTKTKNINKLLDTINNFGMNIRGIYGENSSFDGDMYQISNKESLGITEEEIKNKLNAVTEKIIEQERKARKYLASKSIDLEDEVYRSYGLLVNARKISSEEAKNLLSDVKLGVDLGIIKEIDDTTINKLDILLKPANMQKYLGQTLDENERDIKRAEVIKNLLKK